MYVLYVRSRRALTRQRSPSLTSPWPPCPPRARRSSLRFISVGRIVCRPWFALPETRIPRRLRPPAAAPCTCRRHYTQRGSWTFSPNNRSRPRLVTIRLLLVGESAFCSLSVRIRLGYPNIARWWPRPEREKTGRSYVPSWATTIPSTVGGSLARSWASPRDRWTAGTRTLNKGLGRTPDLMVERHTIRAANHSVSGTWRRLKECARRQDAPHSVWQPNKISPCYGQVGCPAALHYRLDGQTRTRATLRVLNIDGWVKSGRSLSLVSKEEVHNKPKGVCVACWWAISSTHNKLV